MRALAGLALRLAALAAVVFVLVQWLAGVPGGEAVGTAVQRLEAADVGVGPPSPPGAAPRSVAADAMGAHVTVRCLDGPAPRAVLLVDSRPAARFGRGEATVAVRPGDLLEVDGRAYPRRLEFRVTFAGPGLREPAVGTQVGTVGDVALLGAVAAR
jgi:hypothetical protein